MAAPEHQRGSEGQERAPHDRRARDPEEDEGEDRGGDAAFRAGPPEDPRGPRSGSVGGRVQEVGREARELRADGRAAHMAEHEVRTDLGPARGTPEDGVPPHDRPEPREGEKGSESAPRCSYGRSRITAIAFPPPRHRVARPRFAPRSFIAYARVVRTLAPLQPIGWPRATAPPFTLSFSCGIPSSRITARLAAAYASLCSNRSMSSPDRPAFFSSFRTPGIGASMTHSGLTPAVLYATPRASGVTPWRSAASRDSTTIAAPPALNWDALPAVTCPPSRKTGGSFASFSRDVSIRIPSSTSTRPAPGTSTGTICSRNRPSWVADAARRWLSRANRSISSRLILNRSATISPVTPMWNWL